MSNQPAVSKFQFTTEFVKNSPYNTDPHTVQRIKQEGFQEGFQEGANQAEKRLYEEFSAQLGQLESYYTQLEKARQDYIKILTEKTVAVLQASLKHILEDAAENYSDTLLKNGLQKILAEIGDEAALTIRIHPATRNYLTKLKPEILAGKKIQFMDDSSLMMGSCVAEWNSGGMDARLENMLEDMQALFQRMSLSSGNAVEGAPLGTEEITNSAATEEPIEAVSEENLPEEGAQELNQNKVEDAEADAEDKPQ